MSVEAMNYARRVKVGNTTAKFVLNRLADRADERYSCFPSVPLIAAEVETSERSVQRALSLLRELRLISDRTTYRADGSQTTNRYVLHGPWDAYGGTGVPFTEILTPKQARAELWAQAPAEGEFREGTAAAVALSGDQEQASAAAVRAAEATARIAAAQESKKARGRRAAAAKRVGAVDSTDAAGDVSAEEEGVTSVSPPPVTSTSPPPVTTTSPLEPPGVIHREEGKTGGSAVGQSAGGFTRAGASDSAAPKAGPDAGGSAADRKNPPRPKQRPAQKLTDAVPVNGEDDVWAVLDSLDIMKAGTRPKTLRDAVRQLLGHDTGTRRGTPFRLHPRRPEHALARINRGWMRAQCPERSAPGYDGPDAIRKPVGYLAEVLTAQDCIRPECELGVLLTTGEECTECGERAAERAAAALDARLKAETAELAARPQEAADKEHQEHQEHGAVPGFPEQRSTWRCEGPGCGLVGRGDPPDVPLCDECQEDIRHALREAAGYR